MLDITKPEAIEARSFEIIRSELPRPLPEDREPIVMRVIHTTADFSYLDSIAFSSDAIVKAIASLRAGAIVVSDTTMVKAGIDKNRLAGFGGEAHCFIADPDIKEASKKEGVTRARLSVDKAARLERPVIYAVGNAPTALIRISELHKAGTFSPALVIGVPVGFVNVVESKELILNSDLPHIVARGRKGGSNVAAAIINALLRMAEESA